MPPGDPRKSATGTLSARPSSRKHAASTRQCDQALVDLWVVDGRARTEQRIQHASAAVDLPADRVFQPCKQAGHEVRGTVDRGTQAVQVTVRFEAACRSPREMAFYRPTQPLTRGTASYGRSWLSYENFIL
jgi:hypothetical protein